MTTHAEHLAARDRVRSARRVYEAAGRAYVDALVARDDAHTERAAASLAFGEARDACEECAP